MKRSLNFYEKQDMETPMKFDDPAVFLVVATVVGAVTIAIPVAALAGIALRLHRRRARAR